MERIRDFKKQGARFKFSLNQDDIAVLKIGGTGQVFFIDLYILFRVIKGHGRHLKSAAHKMGSKKGKNIPEIMQLPLAVKADRVNK